MSDVAPAYPSGTLVRVQAFGWDDALLGDISEIDHTRAGGPRFLEGELEVRWVESLTYWQYIVRGQFVDEETIVPITERDRFEPNAAQLVWPDKSVRTRKRRQLQSWYREEILCCPPGYDKPNERYIGSLLPEPQAEQGYNFLYRDISDYVDQRAPVVIKSDGKLELVRLKRNMLSSMPMCFNIFGHLRIWPDAAAAALGHLLGFKIDSVERVEVEFAPEDKLLGDHTAFDAFVEYRRGTNRGFLGVETKYTDPFSQDASYGEDKAKRPAYVKYSSESFGWIPGIYDLARSVKTNQVWRNTMLGLSLRDIGDENGKFDEGYVIVLACADDPSAEKVVEAINGMRTDDFLRNMTLEDLVAEAKEYEPLEYWAEEFERRYLDLTPIQS